MLVDILKMPPIFGLPITRNYSLCNFPLHGADLTPILSLELGNSVTREIRNLWKAVYLSEDEKWIFEVVFAKEVPKEVCLYAKMIHESGSILAISFETLRYYGDPRKPLVTVAEQALIGSNPSQQRALSLHAPGRVDNPFAIVPGIFGEDRLWDHVMHILDFKGRQGTIGLAIHNPITEVFRPLYEHAPNVLNALIEGTFYRSPFNDRAFTNTPLRITSDEWFHYNEVVYKSQVMHVNTRVNHPAFDGLVYDVVMMPQVKFSYTTLMSFVVDQIKDVGWPRTYQDPYQLALRGFGFDRSGYENQLNAILYKAVLIYCRLNNIDSEVFLQDSYDRSSITITRNIYDEVSFTFHDLISDRYTCYYSAFPAIAMVTQSVGSPQIPQVDISPMY